MKTQIITVVTCACAMFIGGCGSSAGTTDLEGLEEDTGGGFSLDGASPGDESGLGGEVAPGPCVNLGCKQVACEGGKKTTVSGIVHDPAGKVPLYNVVVYVPNSTPSPLANGATCDKCGDALTGSPLVSTITDTRGRFVLENVPVDKDVPLVIQAGKWRRQIKIPNVAACADTALDAGATRLPKMKSEGDLPQIALTTGGADPLECLLRKIGIDPSEFGIAGSTGKVHFYAGVGGSNTFAGGVAMPNATTLWANVDTLKKYDVVLLACEGNQNPGTKPMTSRQALLDYTSVGGRVFASHWHNVWIENGPAPWPTTSTFNHQPDLADPFTAKIDTSFPKGNALAEWLVNVGGSTSKGNLVIRQAQHTLDAINPAMSQRWIYGEKPTSVQYFTFNTPIGTPAENQCGRVVFSDIHVSSGDKIGDPFPNGCRTADLSPQEKALEFMLFDLTSRVCDDKRPPEPPPK